MIVCIKCNSGIIDTAKFCPECGYKIEVYQNPKEEFQIKLFLLKEKVAEQRNIINKAFEDRLPYESEVDFYQLTVRYLNDIQELLSFQEKHIEYIIDGLNSEMSFVNELQQRGIFLDDDGKWYTPKQWEVLQGQKPYGDERVNQIKGLYDGINSTTLKVNFNADNILDCVSNIKSDQEWRKLLGLEDREPVPKFDYDDMGLIDIADMALAFMSPISAARYIIKKIKS